MSNQPERIPVLFVGTFHMDNPGLDAINTRVDDVRAPARQHQLQELAERLAGFRPTKVAVEAPAGDVTLGERYRRYRDDRATLASSEVEQLGFRVARLLGHHTVHPIDVPDVFSDPELERLTASDAGHAAHYAAAVAEAERLATQCEAWLAEGTIGDALARMNEPERLSDALALYLRHLTPIAEPPAYPGPDMVANWYRRNLRILSHLHRISASGDRLLVIYGHGHVAAFRNLLATSDRFETVDPIPWLGRPPGAP